MNEFNQLVRGMSGTRLMPQFFPETAFESRKKGYDLTHIDVPEVNFVAFDRPMGRPSSFKLQGSTRQFVKGTEYVSARTNCACDLQRSGLVLVQFVGSKRFTSHAQASQH